MRGEKQGQDECLLATIGDLTNTPLAQVRATALAFSGKSSWFEVGNVKGAHELNSLWWRTIFFLCDCYDRTNRLAHVLVQASATQTAEGRALTASCVGAKRLSPHIDDLPLNGKGVIVLANTYNPATGHIVPWELGFAHDTNIDKNFFGEPLSVIRKRYFTAFHYTIQGISQL